MPIVDPIQFNGVCWPDIWLYGKQREILYSVEDNDETYVVAGNMLGKDYVAGLGILSYFLRHHPVKILTTSATEKQLDDLWGEMDQFIRSSKYNLTAGQGGQLIVGEKSIRKSIQGVIEKDSYIQRAVVTSSSKGEGLSGHHAPYTLFVCDEASGVPDVAYKMAQGWAKRMLIFGNPNPCSNFFKRGVEAGDCRAEGNGHFYRKVIRIRAEDSPNVQLAMAQKRANKPVTSQVILPGVLSYADYCKRRKLWHPMRQCIGLDGKFPEDAANLLCPPEWLIRAERIADQLKGRKRTAKTIGVDSGEGQANTSWAVVDELGLIKLTSKRTLDTSVITGETLALMREFGVSPENVLFDRGGGGKQHADRLRSQGYKVRTIAFGGAPTAERRRGLVPLKDRREQDEIRDVYKNRRAEMYGELSIRLDPINEPGFALPAESPECVELCRQLSLVPRDYDGEGKLILPPKTKPSKDSTKETMIDLVGCSPDEADALVLAVFGLVSKPPRRVAKIF